jgi:hypothetical protein
MVRVKGSAALARLRYAQEFFGESGKAALIAALEPSSQRLLSEGVLPRSWVLFDLFVDLNVKADALFGTGDLTLCYPMGRFAADVNFTTLYRIFYKLESPPFFRRASRASNV